MWGHFKSRVTEGLRWLSVIAACGALAACSSDESGPVARDACGAKIGTIESSTRLTFLGAGDVADDVGVLCKRVNAAALEARVEGSGRDRIVIEVSSKDVRAATGLARTGRLAFYDWEANVIGPSGKPAPGDPEVTGGPAAGQGAGELDRYEAVLRASRRPADVQDYNAREGSTFYAVDPQEEKVVGHAAPARAAALAQAPAGARDAVKVLEVKPGTVVLRGERAAADPDDLDGRWYFVLRDDVALRARDVRDPEQNFAEPGSGEPIVTFEFTPSGAIAFQKMTRTLAERGSRRAGVAPGDANQHFAIVLDDQIVSVPYIDFRQNPDGIDGSTGSQIQGGFTIASARELASILGSGELPVPLELVASTKP
jgi:SecD/SecF fusion protein